MRTSFPDYESYFVRLEHVFGNVYYIDYPILKWSRDERATVTEFSRPFYSAMGERGGGGEYIDFFFCNNEITMKYYKEQSHPLTDLAWEGDVETEYLKFEIVFGKQEDGGEKNSPQDEQEGSDMQTMQ